MPQYHYIVGYNSDNDKWFVEYDTTAYLPDGNVFHPDRAESEEWGYNGWYIPDDDTRDTLLDQKCWNMLNSLVPIWPSPVVKGKL